MKFPSYVIDAERESRIKLNIMLSQNGIHCRPFLSGADLIEELESLEPGVILIDVQNAGSNGFDVIEAVARTKFASPIIAMSRLADVEIAVAAMKRGAVDFLQKPVCPEALQKAVKAAAEILGQRKKVFRQVERDEALLKRLSDRESEILSALASGETNAMISRNLELALRTVESHRASLVSKMGLPNIFAAISVLKRYEATRAAHSLQIRKARIGRIEAEGI